MKKEFTLIFQTNRYTRVIKNFEFSPKEETSRLQRWQNHRELPTLNLVNT